MIGLLGKKLGMTHVYDDFGRRRAVTAIQAGPCTILRICEPKHNGYYAVQVGFEPIGESELSKPQLGQFKKAGAGAFRYVREFRLPDGAPPNGASESAAEWSVGQQLTVELFQQYELVDVTGISIGKGFQGGMKRWHWSGGPETHGSMSHRAPGSIGSTTTPGRVWRGHHLPGHMGADRVTVQNVRIVRLDSQHHLLLIEGAIPGGEGGLVFVCKSRKKPGLIRKPQVLQEVVEEDEALSKTAKAASKKLKAAAK
jgi:large subunit ribosomal protein L3